MFAFVLFFKTILALQDIVFFFETSLHHRLYPKGRESSEETPFVKREKSPPAKRRPGMLLVLLQAANK
jgi:hypothetical protein